jgi:hypothetical protein
VVQLCHTWEETAVHAMVTWQSSKKGPTSADMWKTIGSGLLGHTRHPAHQLASSERNSEQQHLLWHCDPSALQNSAAEARQVGQENVLVVRQCSPTHPNMTAQLDELGYMVLPHPPCSPDLASSDYALFDKMKDPLRGRCPTHQWCCTTPKDWFQEAIMKFPQRWHQCIELQGDDVNCHIFAVHCHILSQQLQLWQ